MTAPAEITTPTAYLQSLPPDRRAALTAVHRAIRKTAPELKPHLRSGMLGYGTYHYRYASGREGDWFVVGLCNRKSYLSLYICASDDHGYLAEQNAARLGKVSVGKSCVNFKKLADLNLDVAMDLVRQAAAQPTERIS